MANEEPINSAIRVAAVDDDESIHLLLKDILQPATTFSLVGSFSNAVQALSGLPLLRPDLTLIDVRLPDLNGIECTKRLKQSIPHLKVVIMTGTHEANWAGVSREAGAVAYLVKPFDGEQLLATLRFVSVSRVGNELDLTGMKDAAVRTKATKISHLLSPREKEVLGWLADGLLYKEISDKIGISYSAVHKYVDHIYRKLDVNNRSEAIRIWIDSGCD
jgi:DNA-binding NarL/FixJ family response regulator